MLSDWSSDTIVLYRLFRLFHTVKYLKFKQIFFRLIYKFRRVKADEIILPKTARWKWNGGGYSSQALYQNNKAHFIGKTYDITPSNIWNHPEISKLWVYNLHYFDDLNSNGSIEREDFHYAFIDRWIKENPPCIGNGWEPYPISLRLVNWVKWFSRKSDVESKYVNSIAVQADVLTQQIEYHILGNHLFANAKALVFVGTYLQGGEAKKFLELGLALLDSEISEQFLDDGAHFELSPMYHEILLWDLLELIDLAQLSQHPALLKCMPEWRSVAEKALSWLGSMLHPDGEISFFNDAAIGVAAKPQQIFNYAKKLDLIYMPNNETLLTNKASGYSRVKTDCFTLLFDHANIGPDYLPGHAHADTLSFEISVGQHRLFVNSGTSLYGVSKERLRQRETAAHNTVVVQNQNSSEVWSGFRVARRAYGKLLSSKSYEGKAILVASHDGYKRLKPEVVHTRSIEAEVDGCSIIDQLSSPEAACYHLHLHPDVIVLEVEQQALLLQLPCLTLVTFKSSLPLYLKDSTWHPRFGMSVGNKKIIIPFSDGYLSTNINVLKADR
ncbi:heparinase II/III family protein [Eionea flava]